MNVYVPGSYNQWNPTDPSVRAEQEERKRYVFHRVLPRGIHHFKFVLDGEWSTSWGAGHQQRTVAPSSGPLVADGDNIVVNAPDSGSYTFTLDLGHQRWQVEAAPHASGFAEALNGTTPHGGRLQSLVKALAAVNGNGFPEAMVRDVERMLITGEHRGALPLRANGRALLACLGQPWEEVQVAASWQEWGRNLIGLRHVHNTSLHAALASVPPGVHQYKLVYNGQWMRDVANAWITPDRIPVPKFQLGEFNSVLGMDESPLASGRNLLWYPNFESVHMGNGRDVFIWLPPSYAEGTRRYRTLYMLDGNEFLTRNFLHENVLELARAGEMEECILVFVTFASNNERLAEFSDPILREKYAHFFVDELVPYVDGQFRTSTKAADRGICGVSLGGNFSYYLAWTHSDTFGWAGAQGASWGWNQWDIIRLYQSEPARPIRLYLDSAVGEGENDDSGVASRQTASVLKEQGYPVTHVEMQWQPHDWPSWKIRQPHMIRDFAPVATRSRRRNSTPA